MGALRDPASLEENGLVPLCTVRDNVDNLSFKEYSGEEKTFDIRIKLA